MKYLKYVITGWLFSLSLSLHAQDFEQAGAVMAKGSGTRLAEVSVRNLRTGQYALTNDFGIFRINVSVRDTLLFRKKDYADQKVAVTSTKDMVVQMAPGIMLNEVTVTAKSKKQEMQEVLDDYRKKGVYYNGKPPFLSYLFKPLTALYELIGKTPGQARRFNKYYGTELQQTEIDRKFNKSVVMQYANLPDEKISDFMTLYRPSYETAQYWNEYDVITYIKKSSEDYKKKGEPAVEPLPKLGN
ncbi:hypothetical protein GS399_03680 [Pedobacter sp. HMF7647]|uniref:Carboxypeptidase-like regulatory domain-containing protein n=1 Tax=Hufsiella arboris TaxID=2695275 RepID=A0A7K1Y6J8_9SPHI|nr:hypothetical protein [Hufsiella arboris]MXV50060.1 hypothetical protein [Hufsiella arboris]